MCTPESEAFYTRNILHQAVFHQKRFTPKAFLRHSLLPFTPEALCKCSDITPHRISPTHFTARAFYSKSFLHQKPYHAKRKRHARIQHAKYSSLRYSTLSYSALSYCCLSYSTLYFLWWILSFFAKVIFTFFTWIASAKDILSPWTFCFSRKFPLFI